MVKHQSPPPYPHASLRHRPNQSGEDPGHCPKPSENKSSPLRLDIPQDKDALERADQGVTEKAKVYTDSSARNGQVVSVAATLIRHGKRKPTLHFHVTAEEWYTKRSW